MNLQEKLRLLNLLHDPAAAGPGLSPKLPPSPLPSLLPSSTIPSPRAALGPFSGAPAGRGPVTAAEPEAGARPDPFFFTRPATGFLKAGSAFTTERGEVLCIEPPLDLYWSCGNRCGTEIRQGWGDLPELLRLEPLAKKAWPAWIRDSREPPRLGFLDIETCGFSGSPAFLVGLLLLEEEGFRLRQFFARDFSEEESLLAATWESLEGFSAGPACLVTFNGAAFDLPHLRERSYVHGLRPPAVLRHLDLLPLSRKLFRGRFPDCRLQTLERYLCGRYRVDDLPGSEMGAAYQRFLEEGEEGPMAAALHHNALDLFTTAEVLLQALFLRSR